MNACATDIEKEIFNIDNAAFDKLALKIFLFQYENNAVYQQYCKTLNILPGQVQHLQQIPFLPIQFFKSKKITSTAFVPQTVFESSGTTGSVNSQHLVKDLSLYEKSFNASIKIFYGVIKDTCILGLLPSYLERTNSSLVYMVNNLIKQSTCSDSGFYLDEYEKLNQTILQNEAAGKPTLLIGVTYALLDFAEKFQPQLTHTIVMETGGMKGRRKELTRAEVHGALTQRLGINEVHSEYGMTELLSQAYSPGNGIFNCPPWMKLLLREADDPFTITCNETLSTTTASGVINIIDLANLYSCCFIATDDVGKLYSTGAFEVMGRLDNSDIRGCGLMIL